MSNMKITTWIFTSSSFTSYSSSAHIMTTLRARVLSTWKGRILFCSRSHATHSLSRMHVVTPSGMLCPSHTPSIPTS